jgi:glycosyltransferase involved in cell wall biosynthesis
MPQAQGNRVAMTEKATAMRTDITLARRPDLLIQPLSDNDPGPRRERIRVLQVAATIAPRDGGPPVVTLELNRSLTRRGHSVKLVTTDSDGAGRFDSVDAVRDRSADLDIEICRVHAPRRLKTSVGLWRAIRRELPSRDIVHIHGIYYFSSWIAAREARRAGVPYVIAPHGTLEPYQRQKSRLVKWVWDAAAGQRALANAAGYMYATRSEADGASQTVDPARAHIAPYGATVGDAAGATPVVAGPFVLFLGRIAPKKRLDVLINAFASIAPTWPGTLVIAGVGEESLTLELQQLAQRVLPEERIRFIGHVDGTTKDWLLRNARAFALSSENENFANSVAESMVAGTPVIVTPQVALSELVERYRAGLIVALAVATFAAALRQLLHDDVLHSELSQGARSAAQAEFNWDRMAAAAEQAYLQVLRTRQGECSLSPRPPGPSDKPMGRPLAGGRSAVGAQGLRVAGVLSQGLQPLDDPADEVPLGEGRGHGQRGQAARAVRQPAVGATAGDDLQVPARRTENSGVRSGWSRFFPRRRPHTSTTR